MSTSELTAAVPADGENTAVDLARIGWLATVVACLIAYGTNIGLGKMGAISDMSYQTLFTAANNFLRPETVREGNDRVSNATAKLPIFRHYHIDDIIHSSSDGQKFETQIHTLRSRYSPKYFGLKKGITNYTGVANHVPFNARIIGANESESHYVYDILANNTTESGRTPTRRTRTAPTRSISPSWRLSATSSRRATAISATKWTRSTASSTRASTTRSFC